MAGRESGYGALDAIRATEEYLGIGPETRVGLSGYSGGSVAANWANDLAPTYAPEVNIVGVAEGGLPSNYFNHFAYIEGTAVYSAAIPGELITSRRQRCSSRKRGRICKHCCPVFRLPATARCCTCSQPAPHAPSSRVQAYARIVARVRGQDRSSSCQPASLCVTGDSPIHSRSVFFNLVCWMKMSCSGGSAGSAVWGLLK